PRTWSKLLSSRIVSHRRPAGSPAEPVRVAGVRWQPSRQEEVPRGPENRPWPGHARGSRRAGGPPVVVAGALGPVGTAGAGADRGGTLAPRTGCGGAGQRGLRP